jgi:hypothetical protein
MCYCSSRIIRRLGESGIRVVLSAAPAAHKAGTVAIPGPFGLPPAARALRAEIVEVVADAGQALAEASPAGGWSGSLTAGACGAAFSLAVEVATITS